jgi:integrase
MTEAYPNASSYEDRHGKVRWRYRRKGQKTIQLPGAPGQEEFDAAYFAAVEGRQIQKATVHRLPTAAVPGLLGAVEGGHIQKATVHRLSAVPRSLGAAYEILITSDLAWKRLSPGTRHQHKLVAERFLKTPVVLGEPQTFGEVPIVNLRRKDIKKILAKRIDTPHAANFVLRIIRKLTGVALDEEWIEHDPCYRVKFRPRYKGWKAWPAEVRQAFEKCWPLGSTPRTVYAVALYFGHRRTDVARMKWGDLEAGAGNVVQSKTGKALWIPMHPDLKAALEAVGPGDPGAYVLLTQYGRPFSPKGLGMRMQAWTRKAGLPPGFTLHGLRKSLGTMLAENGATTKEVMAILGHDNMKHTELYTKEAEQKKLALSGMKKLAGPTKKRRPRPDGEPVANLCG